MKSQFKVANQILSLMVASGLAFPAQVFAGQIAGSTEVASAEPITEPITDPTMTFSTRAPASEATPVLEDVGNYPTQTYNSELDEKAELQVILKEISQLKKPHAKVTEKFKQKIVVHIGHRNRDHKNEKITDKRLLQAKELMGPRYKRYFKIAQKIKNPAKHIHEYVKLAFSEMDKKSRAKAHATSSAILSESKKYGFDPFFLLAVIQNESQFNITAQGDAGEIGLMQILPETAKWICEINNIKWNGKKTLKDPVQNIKIGAAYLNHLREQFESDGQLYLAAYNMGANNVYKALSHEIRPKDYHHRVIEFYISYYKQMKKQFEDEG